MTDVIGIIKEGISLVHPHKYKETIKKAEGNWKEVALWYLIVGLAFAFISVIVSWALGSTITAVISKMIPKSLNMTNSSPTYNTLNYLIMLIDPIAKIVFILLNSYILSIIIKMINNGKSNFGKQTYQLFLLSFVSLIYAAVVSWIPCLGLLLSFIYGLWIIYITYYIIKETNEIDSTAKAVGATILFLIMYIIDAAILGAIGGLIGIVMSLF